VIDERTSDPQNRLSTFIYFWLGPESPPNRPMECANSHATSACMPISLCTCRAMEL